MTALPFLSLSLLAAAPVTLPWGAGQSLAERVALHKTQVCTDGKSHYVVSAPDEQRLTQLFSGDGKTFVQVNKPPRGLSGGFFLDPRFRNPKGNDDFNGIDLRAYSHLEVRADDNACTLACGDRAIALKLMGADDSSKLLLGARFAPNPQQFGPHALLMDGEGRYYYIDQGLSPENEKTFRLFVGPKGSLQPQKIKDVASDSGGQILSAEGGTLQLALDTERTQRLRERWGYGFKVVLTSSGPSYWIVGDKKTELKAVPVEENLPLIYNELGLYSGPLGSPCDGL
jgi:hypothetical protein